MNDSDRYRLPLKIGSVTKHTGGLVYDICWDDGSTYGIHALTTMDPVLASMLIAWSLQAMADQHPKTEHDE